MTKFDFIPEAVFTSEKFEEVEKFEKKLDAWRNYYHPSGTLYTIGLRSFFTLSGVEVSGDMNKNLEEVENLIKNVYGIDYRAFVGLSKEAETRIFGEQAKRGFRKLTSKGESLEDYAVFIEVWDVNNEPNTYRGDADGLAGVLEDMNRKMELKRVFAQIPCEVTPDEAREILEKYNKYFYEYYREHGREILDKGEDKERNGHKIEREVLAFGGSSKLLLRIGRSYTDGLTFEDYSERFYTPSGVQFNAYIYSGKSTNTLYVAEHYAKNYNGVQYSKSEPQGFSAGKLNAKKAAAWFDYLDTIHRERLEYIGECNDKRAEAVAKLNALGFVEVGGRSKSWTKKNGFLTCTATIDERGAIHSDIYTDTMAARASFGL